MNDNYISNCELTGSSYHLEKWYASVHRLFLLSLSGPKNFYCRFKYGTRDQIISTSFRWFCNCKNHQSIQRRLQPLVQIINMMFGWVACVKQGDSKSLECSLSPITSEYFNEEIKLVPKQKHTLTIEPHTKTNIRQTTNIYYVKKQMQLQVCLSICTQGKLFISCNMAVHKSNGFWNKSKHPPICSHANNLKQIPDAISSKRSQKTWRL